MTITMEQRWENVLASLQDARGICFDGCHKIYVLMDDQQVDEFTAYGYDIITVDDDSTDDDDEYTATVDEAFAIVHDWYDMSCFLKFVNGVETADSDNRNDDYFDLIPQGAYDGEEDE
jgi:hypothetical protein